MKKPGPEIRALLARRDFLVGSIAVAAGASLLRCSDGDRPPDPRVVDASDADVVRPDASLDETRVQAMLLAGLRGLSGADDLKQAWKQLIPDFASSMRIGLKVNCLSPYLQSSRAVVKALVQTLVQDLGADAQKILVWDRRTDELTQAKLTEAALGVRVQGTITSTTDASGPGYETKAESCRDHPVHLSRLLTEQTDITINLALLKVHNISGITGALKNVFGCIQEPGDLHDEINLDAPALYNLQRLRSRLRLHITEGLLGVTKGDTDSPPNLKPGRLLLSVDPLALDVHALDVINKLRSPLPPVLEEKLGWMAEADRLHLGSRSPVVSSITRPR